MQKTQLAQTGHSVKWGSGSHSVAGHHSVDIYLTTHYHYYIRTIVYTIGYGSLDTYTIQLRHYYIRTIVYTTTSQLAPEEPVNWLQKLV